MFLAIYYLKVLYTLDFWYRFTLCVHRCRCYINYKR